MSSATTDLIERIRVTSEILCDIRRHPAGVRAHLYPENPRIYWQRHLDIDLTEAELQRILEATQRAKETS